MEPATKANILLVDDEAALTKLMQTYLGKLGYNVESALRATEALATFGADPQRFQLLVADLTLPDLPGQDMAVQMLAQNPNLRILLCSGYPFAVDSLPTWYTESVRVSAEAVFAEHAGQCHRLSAQP